MQNFLEQYVSYFLNNNKNRVNSQLIILPSKRAVSALKNTFAVHSSSMWLPQITDIVSFIESISKLNIIGHDETVLEFYQVYKRIHQGKEVDAFENYFSWASVLLSDFNEIDRFLVNQEAFFQYRKALKELDYFGVEKTEMITNYIRFWEDMPAYYSSFKNHLLNNKTAYQGLAYRQAAENIKEFLKDNIQSITFLGFNALNKAEEQIIESCIMQRQAKICWDIDKSYLNEKQHPSNIFVKKYQNMWAAYKEAFIEFEIDNYKDDKEIQILSSPKNIGQAKALAEVLKQLNKEELEQTAIVLNDENLLYPVLNSIPKHIEDVNITMGLPIQQSPITTFFISLTEHQKSGNDSIDYNFLKKIFDQNLLNQPELFERNEILNHLLINNLKSCSINQLYGLRNYNEEMFLVLKCIVPNQSPLNFTNNMIMVINMFLGLKDNVFKQYLLAFKNVFIELKQTIELNEYLSFMAFNILFKEKLMSEKLSFKGSKHKGLQIMGMLETRLLDFENIILTSVNEGILPSGKTDNSYIPFNLKKEYGLPTYTEKDNIYAYHFFRLLQRAKKCYLIYDNDQSGFNKGEQSRYITYLEVFKSPKHDIINQQFSLSTQLKAKGAIEIQKTPDILLELNNLAQSGFSPTALTTYILNPILFYKRYVLKIKETLELEEVISHRDFGTVIHDTLESIYKDTGVLDSEKLKLFKTKTDKLLKSTFNTIYAKGDYESGANRIQLEIARAYLDKFFDKELQSLKNSTTEIISVEESISTSIRTSKNTVTLKGKIDRVDRHGDELRIIDLKTGTAENKHLKFNDFENLISDYDYSKAFQILFYALMYSKKHNVTNITAGIISFKNLNVWFMPLVFNKNKVIDQDMLDVFEEYLGTLIDEILDPNIPFKEKEINFGA